MKIFFDLEEEIERKIGGVERNQLKSNPMKNPTSSGKKRILLNLIRS
jgi:hypothetical protein